MMASTFKRLYSAVEAAEMIMNDWSDDGDNVVDLVVLPPEKVDAMTDDKEIDANGDKLGSALPGDVAGLIEVHTNTANAIDDKSNTTSKPAENDVTLSSNDEKESHILKLLTEINDQKNAKTKWMKKIPTRNNVLLPIDGESLKIKETRNDIVETFAGKQPHGIFEEHVSAELKEKNIGGNKQICCTEKYKLCSFHGRFKRIQCYLDLDRLSFTPTKQAVLRKGRGCRCCNSL